MSVYKFECTNYNVIYICEASCHFTERKLEPRSVDKSQFSNISQITISVSKNVILTVSVP